MEHKYLESFLALTKYDNFSEAANSLYISQSTLSKNIKKLEHELDVQLFNRTNGVSLTPYGEAYLKYASEIHNLYKQAEEELKRMKNEEVALKIGTIPSSTEYGILDFLIRFMKDTGIQCEIITEPSGKLETMLQKGEIDFAFVKNHQSPDLTVIPYQSDHLVAVLPNNHHLAQQKTINLADLREDNFFLEPLNSRPYKLCIQLCKSVGFSPKVTYTDHYIENLIEFVKKGLGVSLLMSKLVPQRHSSVVAIPVKPNATANVEVCYTKKYSKQARDTEFLRYLKKHLQTIRIE